jgi:hypothetical protein
VIAGIAFPGEFADFALAEIGMVRKGTLGAGPVLLVAWSVFLTCVIVAVISWVESPLKWREWCLRNVVVVNSLTTKQIISRSLSVKLRCARCLWYNRGSGSLDPVGIRWRRNAIIK